MKTPNITPTLYHGTAHRCAGDAIIPNWVDTGAAHQYIPTAFREPDDQVDTFDEHRGKFVCATDNLQQAYIYAFKQCDDPRIHPEDRMRHILSVGQLTLADGAKAYHALVAHKDIFLASVAAAEPTIYRMPRVNHFRQVKTIDGKETPEWVTRQPVPLDRCREMQAPSLEEAMKRGLQFFFIDDSVPIDIFQRKFLGHLQQVTPTRDKFNSHEAYEIGANSAYFKVLKACIGDGIIHHYNAEKGICPIDLDTGKFVTSPAPSFADTIDTSDAPRAR